ncbi:MAG: hypothetical protein KF787_04690 [Phycisphaeraceae bacterium]|nr:hypothetical protein [Phycisphaerae bacterium]MBX3391926.1 hypothetical protein [Phycisphaeraceae bacterium]HRJ48907.1 hypothetical protein [Phycisphaerales bacterium]
MARKRKNEGGTPAGRHQGTRSPGDDARTDRAPERAETESHDCQAAEPPVRPRVLVVVSSPDLRQSVAGHLGVGEFEACLTDSIADATARLRRDPFDVAIIQVRLTDGTGASLVRFIEESHPGLCVVMVSDCPTLEEASIALRCGACDLLGSGMNSPEFVDRLADALRRSWVVRDREDRIRKLRKACRELNKARKIVSSQVGSLCDDLATAYQDLTGKVADAAAAAEFNSIVRQELDLESLLRVVLEYVLAKAGPTNAAVFLPASSGDFTLGAYINYDGPKDSAETLLDHLACTIAPRLEHQIGVLRLSGRADMNERLGPESDWIADSHVMAFACHDQGECLAVVLIHRGLATPFSDDFARLVPAIADHFGRQLSRIIRCHHRHLPKDKWGLKPGSLGEDPDIDLAA